MAALSDPLTLPCGLVLPNRIMKAALSEGMANKRHAPDERLERLYSTWSKGGYGLIITGNVMVDGTQLGEPGNVVIEDERNLDALSRWVKATKDGGVPIWAQLNHPGRQSNPLELGATPVAPSAVPLAMPGSPTPRALTTAEIEDIIERFAAAAKVCETAGFDGVQIHGAHGYLVAQFLSPLSNRRDDEWGGDPARRMRFLIEVVRRIRSRVSPGFAVGLKLNSADFQRGGFTEDESRGVLAALAGEGLDLIEVSGGSYEQPAMMGAAADSTRAREAYFLEYARTVRSIVGDVPLAVTGGFRSRSAMQAAVDSGECDVVGLGRPTATTSGCGRRHPQRAHCGAAFTPEALRDAQRPRQGDRSQVARRLPRHQLACRSAAPGGCRARAGPQSGPDRHHGSDAAAQRPCLLRSQAGTVKRRPARSATRWPARSC